MWDFFTKITVLAVVTLLRAVIKNPGSAKAEGTVIAELAQAATEADTLINGTAWSSTPGQVPAPTTTATTVPPPPTP